MNVGVVWGESRDLFQILHQKQLLVLRGMIAAGLTTAAALSLALARPPRSWLPAPGLEASLSHVSTWCMLPLICLALMIAVMARARFLSADDIDAGSDLERGKKTCGYQSILQNTLEQTVLSTATYIIWSVSMPTAMQVVPASAAVLFVAGRVFFFCGYNRGAPARAFGFGLTFYPTVAMMAGIFGRMAAAASQ